MSQKSLTRYNIILLTCLLFIILFLPLLSAYDQVLYRAIITAIIISGIFSLDFRPKVFIILIICGSLTISLFWLSYFFDFINPAAVLASFCFTGFITVFMIRHIFKSQKVTGTIILNSINGYLLLGLLWALLLSLVEKMERLILQADIRAINFADGTAKGLHDYLYFSFVTLSTLGYGDVTPISYIAKSVTLIIAVSGQLYLTILVAVLVGKFLRRDEKE